eukprot:646543-Heterocapsa_arctica.AAC.1
MQVCSAVTDADLDLIFSDFELGIMFMSEYASQKLECWTTLPWRLAALADPDTEQARRSAVSCLDEFDRQR